jgi:hypothetical protein
MKKNDPGRHSDFFDISFTFEQEQFIRELYEEHGGKHKSRSPYEEAWFWGQFYDKGQEFTLTFHSRPQMVITGMAVSEHYKDFQSYKPSEIEGSFLRTIIPNMGMKIRDMVSFKEFAGISV